MNWEWTKPPLNSDGEFQASYSERPLNHEERLELTKYRELFELLKKYQYYFRAQRMVPLLNKIDDMKTWYRDRRIKF